VRISAGAEGIFGGQGMDQGGALMEVFRNQKLPVFEMGVQIVKSRVTAVEGDSFCIPTSPQNNFASFGVRLPDTQKFMKL
jgi:hypothetical protein